MLETCSKIINHMDMSFKIKCSYYIFSPIFFPTIHHVSPSHTRTQEGAHGSLYILTLLYELDMGNVFLYVVGQFCCAYMVLFITQWPWFKHILLVSTKGLGKTVM